MSLRILVLLSLMTCPVLGQADIRYDVEDQIKTDKIDYTIEHDCVVYSWNVPPDLPDLQYHVITTVWGCAQKSFTYEDQDYNKSFSIQQYNELAAIVKHVNLSKFQRSGTTSCLMGRLQFDGGQEHLFNTPMSDPARRRLHETIIAFLDQAAPKSKRTITVHTIEGDFQPPRDVTIKELLLYPAKYNGKRVRLSGYYHHGEDESSFSQNSGDDFNKAISLDDESIFSKPADIHWIEDGHLLIEGTFMTGPSGWGGLSGEIARLTKVIPLDPPPPPPPPADQSSKR